MVLLPQGLQALKKVAKEVGLDLRGAYLNLDGGFDSAHNRKCIFNAGMIPNIKENPRNRKTTKRVVYLYPAAKYKRPAWRPSPEQKGLDEQALMASPRPSPPW
jgi:hypothetical protein